VSCGNEPVSNAEGEIIQSSHTAEIAAIVQQSSPAEIERKLTALLGRIIASNGSPGTELVAAGFAPAPSHRQIYGWEGTGRDGRIGVGVTIDGKNVRVSVKNGGWR
jgi:hypothetical protein